MAIKIGNNSIGKIFVGSNDISKIYLGNNSVYEEGVAYTGLCLTAMQSNSTVKLSKYGSPSVANTEYSLNGTTWQTYTLGTQITLASAGSKVYFRNDITGNFTNKIYLYFTMSGLIKASGNINSMYDSDGFETLTTLTYEYCFARLFYNCSALSDVSELLLPATTLSNYCYFSTFFGCTSIDTTPKLQATNLADSCYRQMFVINTSLTTISKMSATELKDHCYFGMYGGCSSLYASDSSGSGYSNAINFPTTGTFTNSTTYIQEQIFTDCLGTRASDGLDGTLGSSKIFYTQNQPI